MTALKKADTLYLATDPDREGEAISWHLYELLKERANSKTRMYAASSSMKLPSAPSRKPMERRANFPYRPDLAQQARRALDYLLGFQPFAAAVEEDQTRLSAGRVQSPALRMIVEREEEIEAFKPARVLDA